MCHLNISMYALAQKQQDLRGCLDAALEQVETLRVHVQERDAERRELEHKIQEARKETQDTKKALEESLRDSKRYCRSLELISRYILDIYDYPIVDYIRATKL